MAAGQGFKTFVTGDVLTAADTNGYLMQGVWVFADAAARSAAVTSPQEGNMSFLKDTNSTEYYSGSAWVAVGASSAYASWTPTLTNLTLGNGTMTGRYVQIGKFVNASLKLVFGSTTSVTGTMTFSLPTGAASGNTATNTFLGNVRILDNGIANYVGMVQLSSTSAVILCVINVNGTYGTPENVNATVPFTWGNLDEIEFSMSYEAV